MDTLNFIVVLGLLIVAWQQHRHTVQSIQPVADFWFNDFKESQMKIELCNKGLGTMKVVSFIAKNNERCANDIVKLVKLPENVKWTNFSTGLEQTYLSPNERITLIELDKKGISNDDFQDVRKQLAKIEITVEYTDICGRKQETRKKKCSWYGRSQEEMCC